MRYIIFVPAYDAGGISSYCGDLANELIRSTRNVLLVIWVDRSSHYSVKKKDFLENIPQIWVELDSLDKSTKIAKQLSEHLNLEDDDILCSSSFPWISALVTCERKIRKIFHIEFIHGDSESCYDHAIRVYNSCDLFVVMSKRMERNLKKHLIRAGNIEVPCIICPAGIVAADTIPIRSFDVFGICYVGRLDPILKRVYDLVELIKKLMEYKIHFQFTIIGGGVNVLPDLKKKITDLGADSFVEVTGTLSRKEVLKYLRKNQAIVLTSSVEGFPVALCEGMGQVAEVMNKLVDINKELCFSWVCSAVNHGQARQLLSSAAREKVNFLDWMSQSELIKIYDNHGIFLFPSFFEGFGKVFLEAMARGLCVIASDNSGVHDVIENHVNSILVSTGSVDEMYQECLGMIEKPESAVQLSKQARKTAEHYTWHRVAKRTLELYESRLREKR